MVTIYIKKKNRIRFKKISFDQKHPKTYNAIMAIIGGILFWLFVLYAFMHAIY
jgi:hypothetical protein